MRPPPPHELVQTAAASFGICGALLLVGGFILLRAQRNRHRYLLMKTALERGVTPLRDGPPFWVISLRQGFSTLTLGVGLLIIGIVLHGAARRMPMPTMQALQPQAAQPATQPMGDDVQPGLPNPAPPQDMDNAGDNGPNQLAGPPRQGPDDQGPPDRPGAVGGPAGMDGPDGFGRSSAGRGLGMIDRRPPAPNPQMEAWHRAQGEKSLGLICAGAGFILTLLGIVRIGFAGVERRHTPAPIAPGAMPSYSPNPSPPVMPPPGM